MFAWRKVRETWSLLSSGDNSIPDQITSLLETLDQKSLTSKENTMIFFLGLHLFCDFSWNTVGKIGTNKIVSINFIFFFFFSFILSLYYLEKEMATHSSVLAWRIQGTEGSGGLLSVGLYRVRHD